LLGDDHGEDKSYRDYSAQHCRSGQIKYRPRATYRKQGCSGCGNRRRSRRRIRHEVDAPRTGGARTRLGRNKADTEKDEANKGLENALARKTLKRTASRGGTADTQGIERALRNLLPIAFAGCHPR